MAKSKYKITGFARFLIFMLFFAPLAYIGVSYYQGEDGIQNFKNLIGYDKKETVSDDQFGIEKKAGNKKHVDDQDILKLKDLEIEALKKRIEHLEEELRQQNIQAISPNHQ